MRKSTLCRSMIFQKMVTGLFLVVVFAVLFVGILVGSGDGEFTAMRREGNHTKAVRELHSLKVVDASDTQAIEKLMYTVIDEVFLYRGWDDDTDPFAVTVKGDLLLIDYNVCINRPDSFQRLTADYSAIFLALIPDIRQIQWEYEEIQYGGIPERKTLYYDWNRMKDEEFIDPLIVTVAKDSGAKDFGASASALQLLMNSFTYYDRYKAVEEKKPETKVTEEQMIKEIEALPLDRIRSYDNMAKNSDIYVEGIHFYEREEQNRELWDSFYEKAKKGEAASLIVGGYNSLENLSPEENGSVNYCNIHYDGEKYYALYDYIDSSRADDFGEGVVTGKYLLSGSMEDDPSLVYHFITDDPSVSWRDVMYSALYAGTYEFAPIDMVEAHCVMYEYKNVK